MVSFYDSGEIRSASFVCSSQSDKLDAQNIITNLLYTEDDLRYFCKTYIKYQLVSENFCRLVLISQSLSNINTSMVIEAYKYLTERYDKGGSKSGYSLYSNENRKRKASESQPTQYSHKKQPNVDENKYKVTLPILNKVLI